MVILNLKVKKNILAAVTVTSLGNDVVFCQWRSAYPFPQFIEYSNIIPCGSGEGRACDRLSIRFDTPWCKEEYTLNTKVQFFFLHFTYRLLLLFLFFNFCQFIFVSISKSKIFRTLVKCLIRSNWRIWKIPLHGPSR